MKSEPNYVTNQSEFEANPSDVGKRGNCVRTSHDWFALTLYLTGGESGASFDS